MAACATTFSRAGRGWSARIAEHNAELMAQQAQRRRARAHAGVLLRQPHLTTPAWSKPLIRCGCARCASFAPPIAMLFSLVMVYGLQHFYAIESSYRVEWKSRCSISCARRTASCASLRPSLRSPAASTRWLASLALPSRSRDRWFIPTPAPDAPSCPVARSGQLLLAACRLAIDARTRAAASLMKLSQERFAMPAAVRAIATAPDPPRVMPLKRSRFWLICLFFLLWACAIATPPLLAPDRAPPGVRRARPEAAAAHL